MTTDVTTEPDKRRLILASASPTRARLLRNAGVAFDIMPASVDEEKIKIELGTAGKGPEAIAAALAHAKAAAISAEHPDRLVIGADQVLDIDGEPLGKPDGMEAARVQLRRLSGVPHDQISCVSAIQDGRQLWHHEARATLWVRDLSDDFIGRYLEIVGDAALNGPGAYQLEAMGAQLFERIDGDFFTVLGLPLMPLLGFLRARGVLPS